MVAVSYYPALFGGFVSDDVIFAEAPVIHAWSGLWNIWFSPADIQWEGHYWPILYTTFWLEHKLWGLNPFGYHLVNVLLYIVNVLLLWRLLRCLAVPGAWAVAAVFAVHPMHIESVAWVIGRKDLLSGLFYMACAFCLIRSVAGAGGGGIDAPGSPVPKESPLPQSSWARWWPIASLNLPRPELYVAALGLFVAAMLSKSVAVTLPVAFALWLWWKNGRLTWTDAWRILPFLLVALCIAVADLSYYTSRREFPFEYGFPDRVLIAARALWFYAGKLVWPTDLAVFYPLWDIDAGDSVAWGYVVAAGAVAALLLSGRHWLGRAPLVGAAFFVLTLSPTLGLVDYMYMSQSFVADRYAYLAGIGVISVFVGTAAYCVSGLPNAARIGAAVVLVAVLVVFGKLTWEQAGVFRDEIAFYNHIISLNPKSPTAHFYLASALRGEGHLTEALAASRIAVERRPGHARSHSNLGLSLLALDRPDEAAGSFRRAVELDPSEPNARRILAEIQSRQGRFGESVRWYREVIDRDPESASAHRGLGVALFRLGQYEQAVESLERADALLPDTLPVGSLQLLAEALLREQRYEEALERYRGVLEINPKSVAAHTGIGYALFHLKRFEEAIDSLARSVSLVPESPAAADGHVVIGQASMELGREEVAAEHYARALAIDPRNTKALDALAVLRFRQQRYEEALHLYGTMIDIGEANAQVHANMGAVLYHLGRPEEALRSLERARALDPTLDLIWTGAQEPRDTPMQERE
ncbi:MAG: tetratricopeptide repeat protein [bacterium]|nr:tetratricopeptide repeat protein [bacterium]